MNDTGLDQQQPSINEVAPSKDIGTNIAETVRIFTEREQEERLLDQ